MLGSRSWRMQIYRGNSVQAVLLLTCVFGTSQGWAGCSWQQRFAGRGFPSSCDAGDTQGAGAIAVPAESAAVPAALICPCWHPQPSWHRERDHPAYRHRGHLPRKARPSSSQILWRLLFSWLCLENPPWTCLKGKVAHLSVFKLVVGPSCRVG